MNLLIFSDSHRATRPLRQILDLYAPSVQMVIHLGDHADDLLRFESAFPALTMHAVTGNCDGGLTGSAEHILSINGCRILLTHGHRQHVKSGLDRLAYYAEERDVHVCLFGHTHAQAAFNRGPVFFLNPGSITAPRAGEQPGYGLLRISDEGVAHGTLLTLPSSL